MNQLSGAGPDVPIDHEPLARRFLFTNTGKDTKLIQRRLYLNASVIYLSSIDLKQYLLLFNH